jgi:hypothetical protein
MQRGKVHAPCWFVAFRNPVEYWRRRRSVRRSCAMDDWLEKSDTVESTSLQLMACADAAPIF